MPEPLSDMLPTARFDGSQFAPADRFAEWSKLTPGYDKRLPPGLSVDTFEADCSGWLVDDLVVSANVVTPVELVRTPAHIQAYARETYTLILLKRGRWSADLDFGEAHIGSGEVAIMDFTVPWHVRGTAQENVMMVVPRAVIAAAVPDAPRLHGRTLEGAGGRLFAEHMLALAQHLPRMNRSDIPLVRNATISLLGGALRTRSADRPRPAPKSVRAASIGAAQGYIEAHLTDPRLNVGRICQAVAVTRPTLYRAFQSAGGVAGYIQRRRLEAAHLRLSDHDGGSSMAEIADLFCFSSPAHFSTAFRRRFGYTPRSARGTPMQSADARDLFQTWKQVLERAM